MAEKYDVIIIGAGIGGLTAGAILAKNGKKVLILEKNHGVGGYAVNFKRGDFNFDVALHMLDGCDQDKITYRMFKNCGILEKVQFLKPKFVYRSIFPDFDFRVPQTNIVKFIDILVEYFPEERPGLTKFFKDMEGIFIDVEKFLYSYLPLPLELICFPFKYPSLLKYCFLTYENMLDKYIRDRKLKAILSQLWLFYGLPSSKLSSYIYAFPTFDYLNNGATYIHGGGQALSNAIFEVFKENGGEIMFNAESTNILVKNRTVKGVTTKDNEYFADYVISNIDARKTFLELIGEDKLKNSFIGKLKKYKPSLSAFVIYLGLSVSLKEKGIPDYEIFLNPDYDLDKQQEAIIQNDMRNVPFMLTISSNLDESTCPKGKSTMSISIESGYDFWKNLNPVDYSAKKDELASILIKRAENVIPGLSSYIERKEIVTPLTMERYTNNYKGAIFGFSQVVNQSGLFRISSDTPIRNLYLASAWTIPGGGMSAVMHAGERVAEKILRKNE